MAPGSLLLIAVGLSMDAFAVSVNNGITTRQSRAYQALVLALFFGGFQALMAFAGWSLGSLAQGLVAAIDHWIAFVLLTAIAGKMMYEAVTEQEPACYVGVLGICTILALSVATSIDALAVGVSLSLLQSSILDPVVVIGLTTFLLTLIGSALGQFLGSLAGKRFEFLGGLILLAIGAKILIEHLCSHC